MSGITAGTVFHLQDLINIRPFQISSRTLSLNHLAGSSGEAPEWVLYAMAAGETISSETAPRSKIIHVLEGELHMLVAELPCHLTSGASVIVTADTWHEFAAHSSCKFIQISL
ncbi:cupin domain-containing protein [Paenibacillus sp. MMS20-IR301]|uniref:cupin domain-containing protein n=1 Tax=Paenibacillus sp. MMS20-IR301 TaxID=2895946 RepID=UPI0028E68414|nr:cupin domain-containing protein [Paenibacillus sp. MMS20-IR301]WNS45600.1 cupin domain-containing protein [Paenibacillus sp. MMS20-IR301]